MVENLHFTTVLSIRHARGEERVAAQRKFVLAQFLSVRSARSDERVVKSKGGIPAPRREKDRF